MTKELFLLLAIYSVGAAIVFYRLGWLKCGIKEDQQRAWEEMRKAIELKRAGASAYLTPGRVLITRAAFMERLKGSPHLPLVEEWLNRPDCLGVIMMANYDGEGTRLFMVGGAPYLSWASVAPTSSGEANLLWACEK